MSKQLLSVTAFMLFAIAGANAELHSVDVIPVHEGYLSGGPTYVYSYDLHVTITGADAWSDAGGLTQGDPWITLTGGTFYQNVMNDSNPPDTTIIEFYPESNWTSFYTTHLGYPNTAATGVSPGFTFGPNDQPTELIADWYWPDDGLNYAGTFTIARFTIIEDVPGVPAVAHINMQVGSRASGTIPFETTIYTPEPAGLALLAFGGLILLRRR